MGVGDGFGSHPIPLQKLSKGWKYVRRWSVGVIEHGRRFWPGRGGRIGGEQGGAGQGEHESGGATDEAKQMISGVSVHDGSGGAAGEAEAEEGEGGGAEAEPEPRERGGAIGGCGGGVGLGEFVFENFAFDHGWGTRGGGGSG